MALVKNFSTGFGVGDPPTEPTYNGIPISKYKVEKYTPEPTLYKGEKISRSPVVRLVYDEDIVGPDRKDKEGNNYTESRTRTKYLEGIEHINNLEKLKQEYQVQLEKYNTEQQTQAIPSKDKYPWKLGGSNTSSSNPTITPKNTSATKPGKTTGTTTKKEDQPKRDDLPIVPMPTKGYPIIPSPYSIEDPDVSGLVTNYEDYDPINRTYEAITDIRDRDLALIKNQQRDALIQLGINSAAGLGPLMNAMFADEPEYIGAPVINAPYLQYDDTIYREREKENLAGLAAMRNYLSQYGMQEMAGPMLADWMKNGSTLAEAEEKSRREYLNKYAELVSGAQAQNDIARVAALKEHAAAVDAANRERSDVVSNMSSQLLGNYFAYNQKKRGLDAETNKVYTQYDFLRKLIEDEDEDQFNLYMASVLSGRPDVYLSQGLKSASEAKTAGYGDQNN